MHTKYLPAIVPRLEILICLVTSLLFAIISPKSTSDSISRSQYGINLQKKDKLFPKTWKYLSILKEIRLSTPVEESCSFVLVLLSRF